MSRTQNIVPWGVWLLAGMSWGLLSQPIAPAAEKSGLFDWRSSAAIPGGVKDVTSDLARNIEGNTLDLGTGKIVLTPRIKLKSAVADHVKLSLVFQVEEANQTMELTGLVGMNGHYLPAGANLRNIRIEKSPHSETFLRKGELTLLLTFPQSKPAGSGFAEGLAERKRQLERERQNPPQWKPFPGQPEPEKQVKKSPLVPGPETGYKPRSMEFAQLAAAISGKYVMPGRDTHRPYAVQWRQAAEAAAKYPAPELHKYSTKMLERAQADANIDLAAVRAKLRKDAERLANKKIGYGTVIGYETTDSFGNQRPVFASGNEPDLSAQQEARELEAIAGKNDQELRAWVIARRDQNGWEDLFFGDGTSNNRDHMFQNLVMDARKVLVADAAQHAGPVANSPLVQFRRADSKKFKLRNVSQKSLSDALVMMKMGFTKSDKLKQFRAPIMLFVPQWKAGDELEMDFEFNEPTVVHAQIDTYANEASLMGTEFSLVDPQSPPSDRPGKIVLRSDNPLSKGLKVWAELDGQRFEWEEGKRQLDIPAAPGKHQLVVKGRNGKITKTLHTSQPEIDAEDYTTISIPSK